MPDAASALRGSLWMVLAAAFFAVMGVLVKLAGKGFAPAELVFYRCLLGLGGIGIASMYQGRSLYSIWLAARCVHEYAFSTASLGADNMPLSLRFLILASAAGRADVHQTLDA